MKILLLEDNFATGESVDRALRARGYNVVWVKTVAEAKAAYSPDLFDVMVIDYELPDGTGLDFLATIRGSDKAKTILSSGLDRSRELKASGLEVSVMVSKADPRRLFEEIKAVDR